ncbi:zinc transporter ZntB [Litoreibacter sp.]|nr:zinc transporter ZntB [Litoreibacter sp.]
MPICEFTQDTYRWLHFDANDPALPAWLGDNVPELPRATLLQTETRPRCDIYHDGLILNLRGVNMNEGQDAYDMVSLRMWITDGLIVSVRFRKIFAVDDLRKEFEAGNGPKDIGAFLVQLTHSLTNRIETTVLRGNDRADNVEEAVFEHGATADADIGPARREVISLRRYMSPQKDALQKLTNIDVPFLDEAAKLHLRETANRTIVAVESLHSVHERLIAAQDHLDTAHANRLGRNGYVLSIVAAIFLPLGFLTGLFGMNVAGLPGTEWPMAFAALCIAMIVVAAVLLIVFKIKDWL